MTGAVSIHPVKAGGGRCTICHEPHNSKSPKLLRGDVNSVCGSCHKGHSQFGHPVGSNVMDPRTGKGMTCLSCHFTHASQQRALLRADSQRALCIECHEATDAMKAVGAGGAPR
ncbi:MAG: cytochrome c3 family protein [Thermoanaerobaculia bacterium]